MSNHFTPPEKVGVVFFQDGTQEFGPPGVPPSTDYVLAEKYEKMKAALERIKAGTHESTPTCMTCADGSFGPPRTGGWEGWAREIDALHKQIATEALE